MKVFTVSPCYLDLPSWIHLCSKLRVQLSPLQTKCHFAISFVLIDDSAGKDLDVADYKAHQDEIIIVTPCRFGHQTALLYGLNAILPLLSSGDIVVTLDADGEDMPEHVPLLIESFLKTGDPFQGVVLARRTSRSETSMFKVAYFIFKIFFRCLTGETIKSGNFAAYPADALPLFLRRGDFYLCYSSAFYTHPIVKRFIDVPRGNRYKAQSKMTFLQLFRHGLRMLLPFRAVIFYRLRVVGTFLAFAAIVVHINGDIYLFYLLIIIISLALVIIPLGLFAVEQTICTYE